jgi:DNA-directed RNA polymerase subunit RPC12/RpoP
MPTRTISIEVTEHTCNLCGHKWHQKKAQADGKPIRCAHCRSPYWDRERMRPKAKQ